MSDADHDLNHGADCWCEPRTRLVVYPDGTSKVVYIHTCNTCHHNPCLCPDNIIEGGD